MQNCHGWMAGSNLKKLRGVRAKFWGNLQILLNGTGLRVDSQELQGLFSKVAARRGMFRSGPLDCDLAAQGGSGLDLI